jgi:hypothetical protein
VPTVERNRLLSKATAVLMPTLYLEPFGNVSAEAQLCGTPVISCDYGAFRESVEPGVSGYRCTSLGEYRQAIGLASSLDRVTVRRRAQRLYSTESAMVSYAQYFRRLLDPNGFQSLWPGLEEVTHGFDTVHTRTDRRLEAGAAGDREWTDERVPATATA